MNLPRPFLLSAAVTLIFGIVIFVRQASQLEALQPISTAPANIPHSKQAKPSKVLTRAWSAPPSSLPEADGSLLDRIGEKMVASMDRESLLTSLGHQDMLKPGRVMLAANLDEAGRAAFETIFRNAARERVRALTDISLTEAQRSARLTEITANLDASIASQLSPGQQQAVQESETRAARAAAESNATSGVSRISRATDLTDAQKDTLYAAFLDRAQRPEASIPSGQPMVFGPYARIKEEPPVPDLTPETKTILTPERWSQYEKHRQLPSPYPTFDSMVPSLAAAALASLAEMFPKAP